MNLEEKTQIITLTRVELADFAKDFEANSLYGKQHIILDLLAISDLEDKDLIPFVKITKNYLKKNKKSFVIVNDELEHGLVPNEISFAPTIQEAFDIIEMEEIERDLGF